MCDMDHDVPLPLRSSSQRETARSYNPIQGLLLVTRYTLTSSLTRTIRYKQMFAASLELATALGGARPHAGRSSVLV